MFRAIAFVATSVAAGFQMRLESLHRVLRFPGVRTGRQNLQIFLIGQVCLVEQLQLFLGLGQAEGRFRVARFVKQRVIEAVQRRAEVLLLEVIVADLNVFRGAVRIPGMKALFIDCRSGRRFLGQWGRIEIGL